MMRKAKWKRVVAAGAILMSLGMVFPATDIQAEEVDFGPGIVEIVDDDNISTCADQIRIVYRIHNGRRQKRRWNQTQVLMLSSSTISTIPGPKSTSSA